MTARERAKDATCEAGMPDWGSDDQEQLEMAVEQAITAAVEEEREACAKILDNTDAEPYCSFHISELARQIRARSNPAE